MKKVLLALAVMVMSLGFVSCKNSGADLKSIVEKAKTEGSKWTVDEWKTAFKDAVMAVKPAYEKMASVAKKAEGITDASELAKVMEEMQQVQKDNADVDKLMKEFEEIAKATENGKAVADDEEFGKQVMKEAGLESLI
ncbi:MAG: hypothetical protein II562_06655 [Prevotella sp.]|nr:hypothetical protein [Prevotella sp.]